MLIHDLYSSMVRLAKEVLSLFVKPQQIRGKELSEVDFTDRTLQLADNDLLIGNDARMALISQKDFLTSVEESKFFRYSHHSLQHFTSFMQG